MVEQHASFTIKTFWFFSLCFISFIQDSKWFFDVDTLGKLPHPANIGYVYFVKEVDNHEYFKVGHTGISPIQRLRNLQTGNGKKLMMRAVLVTDMEVVETALIEYFGKNNKIGVTRARERGEWFKVPEDLDGMDKAKKEFSRISGRNLVLDHPVLNMIN